MTKISLVVPVFNEQDNIQPLYQAIIDFWPQLAKKYEFELILINDGSLDNSGYLIEQLAKKDKRIKYIEFSRNFGKEAATSAGLHHVTGQAAIMIDADLQHPIDMIPEFIKHWQRGMDVVVGVRLSNQKEGSVKRYGSKLFYRLFNLLSDTKTTPASTDFRLIDRRVLHTYQQFTEHNRMTRALLDWLGFKYIYVPFHANPRLNGEASYSTIKLLKLATSSFVAHSQLPLKLAGYLGLLITIISGILGVIVLFEKYIFRDPLGWNITGSATLGLFTTFLVGIILTCLGLMAIYIGTIHTEIMNRPMYVVRRTINIKPEELGIPHHYE